MGSQGAACFHTLTTEEEDLPKAVWDIQRFGQVCTTSDTFADWKQVIEKLCSYSHDCKFQTKQEIEAFFQRVEEFKLKRDRILETMSPDEKERLTHY